MSQTNIKWIKVTFPNGGGNCYISGPAQDIDNMSKEEKFEGKKVEINPPDPGMALLLQQVETSSNKITVFSL